MHKNKSKVQENQKKKKTTANITKKKNMNQSNINKTKKKKSKRKPKQKDYLLMVMKLDKKSKKNNTAIKKLKNSQGILMKIQEKSSPLKIYRQQYYNPLKINGNKRQDSHFFNFNKISLNQNSLIKDEIQNCEQDLIFISQGSQVSRQNQISQFQSQTQQFQLRDQDNFDSFQTSSQQIQESYLNQTFMNQSESYFQSSSQSQIMENIQRLRQEYFLANSTDQIVQDQLSLSYQITIYNQSESSKISISSLQLDIDFPRIQTKPHHYDKQCSICLENYKKDQIIRQLPCSHLFHKNCIDHWIKKNLVCPFCRHIL